MFQRLVEGFSHGDYVLSNFGGPDLDIFELFDHF